MFRQKSLQAIVMSMFMVAVFLVGAMTTEAARKDPGLSGNHLTIEAVAVDFNAGANGQLTLLGDSFSFGNTLNVTLGEEAVPLNIVGVPTDTEIVAELPAGLLPGDYLLTVSTGNGQSQNDEYDLTIGAVGPAGGDGDDGAPGPPGPPGADATFTLSQCPDGEFAIGIDTNGLIICTETVPPSPGACPCSGITFLNVTWGDDFDTKSCTIFGNGGVEIGDTDDIGSARFLSVDKFGVAAVPRCQSRGTDIPGIPDLTEDQFIACGNELVAIAENDGIQCN